jgi:hypothetical protein
MSRWKEWAIITLILLLAAVLRLWALGDVPPGLCHDEVAHWLIDRDILAGHHAIYFTAAYGHEPLYHYVQAATIALFGDQWVGLRWPSVAFGLLGIAATYTLIRRLFDAHVALLTAAWLALSFWPLFYARVGLRAIMLPCTATISIYFFFRAIHLPPRPSPLVPGSPPGDPQVDNRRSLFVISGFFLGLSLYVYMSARILPFILASFLIYLFLVYPQSRKLWGRMLLTLAVAALVSAPLVIWLATHPGAEYRVAEVQEPLDRLLAGDPSLIWRNLIANLKFFTFAGDPWPRQNLPGRPIFADPISAVLFYAGLLIALRRWRDPRYGLLFLWLVGALVPSIITSDAPSSIRNILGLAVVFVFPALALVETGRWLKRRMQDAGCRMQEAECKRLLPLASCLLLLASCFFLTVHDYFIEWPQNDVVRFDYQTDLTAVAHRLDELPPGTPVAVAGLSVDSMDGPGLELAARRDVHHVRLCDTRQTLVVPAGRDVWLFVPQVVPFDVDLRARLMDWGGVMEADPRGSFTGYRLPNDVALSRGLGRLEASATLPNGAPAMLPVSFGGRLTFLGYEWLQQPSFPGDPLALLTYWRVETPSSTPLKVFVHLAGKSQLPIAQHDGLGSPPRGWATGDLIIQKHTIFLPPTLPPGRYHLQVGAYDAVTDVRLPVLTADHLLLYSVEVPK